MATPHINAEMGAFADVVLMPGDPLRAKYIAETFLEDVVQVCDVRNMFGYTGTYKGRKISVMGHAKMTVRCVVLQRKGMCPATAGLLSSIFKTYHRLVL